MRRGGYSSRCDIAVRFRKHTKPMGKKNQGAGKPFLMRLSLRLGPRGPDRSEREETSERRKIRNHMPFIGLSETTIPNPACSNRLFTVNLLCYSVAGVVFLDLQNEAAALSVKRIVS